MDKKLLQRYIEGSVTTEEIESVVDWLDQDEKHVKEFMSLHKLYDISIMNQSKQQQIQRKMNTSVSLKRIAIELLKIAAIVLILIGGRSLLDKRETEEDVPLYQTLFVPSGQRAELTLPDSTKVWLNAQSRLVYPVTFQKSSRQVELDGEAYFEVKRNEKSPFIVKTEKMNIKVLGTEFNVSAYSEVPEFEISLLKGVVELASVNSSNTYKMKPGEQIRLVSGKYISTGIKDMDYFKWKEGLLCFTNSPIEEIIHKLCLYYDVKIEVAALPFLKESYSGKFRVKDGVEHVLKVLQLEHKFSYKIDNELNLITIK